MRFVCAALGIVWVPMAALAQSQPYVETAEEMIKNGFSAAWYQCKSATDCVVVRGPCGSITAVGSAQASDYKKNAQLRQLAMDCEVPQRLDLSPYGARCDQGVCTVKPEMRGK